ncbi:MAG: hypothetical protein JWN78_1229 [Bacteroidota bacterium]|nr:hypothetical protein [Bacteroidota bacterium]
MKIDQGGTSAATVLFRNYWKLSVMEGVCLLLTSYLLTVRIMYIFSYNTDMEGVEFASIHFLQLLKLKHHIYSDPGKFPYLLVVYAPLYYYVMLGVINLFSVDVLNNIHSVYIIGRVISFLLLFLNFFIVKKIVEQFIPDFRSKIYLFLFLLLLIPLHFYTFRPDSFKVTSFVIFIYYFLKFVHTNAFKYYLLSFIFLYTGILFKQDVLIYGLITYLFFYFVYRKKIYLFTIPVLFITLFITGFLLYSSAGIDLYKELFVYNIQYDRDPAININTIIIYLMRVAPLLYLAVKNLYSENKLVQTLAGMSLVYTAGTLATLMRMGANFNYTYEASILLLINGFIYFKGKITRKNEYPVHVYIVYVLISIAHFYPLTVSAEQEKVYKISYFDNLHLSNKIKPILKNDVVFLPQMKNFIFYPEQKLIYGYDWHYDRYCELNLNMRLHPKFASNDVVDQYDENFRNGKVKYILIEDNVKAKPHIEKYYPGFVLDRQIENFLLYVFKPTK